MLASHAITIPQEKGEQYILKALFTAQMVILLFVLIRSADLAITHSIIRAVVYGIIAILALIAVILVLI